jgi:hypothetical protein
MNAWAKRPVPTTPILIVFSMNKSLLSDPELSADLSNPFEKMSCFKAP